MYFANPSTEKVRDAMRAGVGLGMIDTPRQGNKRPKGVVWCADNGCFGTGYPGDEAWLAWLDRNADDAPLCAFATAPDVVGDATATMRRSRPFLSAIRDRGYPAALVAQDGLENLSVPWDEIDALFIGGSTDWKLSAPAETLCREAQTRGKWVHMGRVNSRKRLLIAKRWGCDSADGTYIAFGPDINLPKVLTWLSVANDPAA
jgi:hypothetical protein